MADAPIPAADSARSQVDEEEVKQEIIVEQSTVQKHDSEEIEELKKERDRSCD